MIHEKPPVTEENSDILDLGLGDIATKRFIHLRLMARDIVKGATESQDGQDRLRKVMVFLNNEIESLRDS